MIFFVSSQKGKRGVAEKKRRGEEDGRMVGCCGGPGDGGIRRGHPEGGGVRAWPAGSELAPGPTLIFHPSLMKSFSSFLPKVNIVSC